MKPSIALIGGALLIHSVWSLSWQDDPSSAMARSTFRDMKQKWVQHNFSMPLPKQGFEQALLYQSYPDDQHEYFEYSLLADQQIRLLQVACKYPGRQYSFELVHVTLDHVIVPYIAVSYTWGENCTIHSTMPNGSGKHLNLTEVVFHILDSFLDEGESLYLWIDALCINQKDYNEKNHQVRLMREIYQQAQQVVISLGESSHESRLAMDFIEPLKTAIEELYHEGAVISEEAVQQKLDAQFLGPVWTALSKLFRRRWFSRIWVIQEVVFGADPILVLGDRAVKWNTMIDIAMKLFTEGLLMLLEYDHNYPTRRQPEAEGIKRIGEMHEARSIKQNGEQRSFQEILMVFHHFDAANDSDKVFALLGLASDAEDQMLDPNYTAIAEEVYFKTARHLLLRGDDSIFIVHRAGIGFPGTYPNLPSWVPNWRSPSMAESFGGIYRTAGYQAAGKTIPSVQPGSEPKTLVFDGLLIDKVEQISSVWAPVAIAANDGLEELIEYNIGVVAWLKEAEDMVNRLKRLQGGLAGNEVLYSTGERFEDALCKTLIANTTRLSENSLDPVSEDLCKAVEGFNNDCIFATMERRFFINHNGLMGLTSPGTQLGDLISILIGGVTPFIIRNDSECEGARSTYRLVGEAYVHGLMNGEGLDMAQISKIELR